MKTDPGPLVFVAALVFAMIFVAFACHQHGITSTPPPPSGHLKAEYVRNQAHHCKTSMEIKGRPYLQEDGSLRDSGGWKDWDCDNDVSVIIDADEEQP